MAPSQSTDHERRFVRREVRAHEPSLSDEANRLLTQELRRALGTDAVAVPAGTPEGPPSHTHPRTTAASNRLLLVMTFATMFTAGVVASLATGSWWALVVAVGVHAAATIGVILFLFDLTARPEHVDPSTAARLEEEGVTDPDRLFSTLVDEYRGDEHARRVLEGQEQPGLAWRSYAVSGLATVLAAMVAMIVVGLLIGWF